MQTEQRQSWPDLFKQSLNNNHRHDFTQGSIGRCAFLLAVPMVVEMVMEAVFAIVDIFFVSGLGADAVAVIGLAEAALGFMYAISIGLSMATTALVARRIGDKNLAQANMVAAQALWVGLVVAVVMAMIGLYFAKPLLRAMGGSANIVALGEGYTTIMLSGSITVLYLFLMNAIFRGAGDATIAMRSLWLANGINIMLDPLLIYGIGPFPEYGVTGAAIATNVGRGIGVCYQLYHLRSHASRIHIKLQDLAPRFAVLSQLARITISGSLQHLITTVSWIALMVMMSQFGSAAIAGYTISIRIMFFAILPVWGLSSAAATLVGQNLGARDTMRAERSIWAVMQYTVYFMLAVSLVLIVFTEHIIGIFSNDIEVIGFGVTSLHYISYGCGFYAIGIVLMHAFNGAGDTQTPLRINFFCYGMCQLPLAYMLTQNTAIGPNGVFLSITFAQLLLAVVAFIWFYRGEWKAIQI